MMGGFTPPQALQNTLNMNREYSTINEQNPFGSTTWNMPENGPWTRNQQFDPRIMSEYYNNLQQSQNIRGVANNALANAESMMAGGFNPSGLPALSQGINFESLPGMSGSIGANPFQTGFNRSGFQKMPGAEDFGAERQRVEDSLYNKFAGRADQKFKRARTDQETKLRNQGFTPGTEAYSEASRDLGNMENDAYQQAAYDANTGATAQQSQMLADALRIRGQQNEEGMQDFGMFNSGNQQDFNQRLAAAQFGNQARGQSFGEQIAAGQFGNQSRSQGFQEQLAQYQLPFQTFNQLYKGSNMQLPSMGSGQRPISAQGMEMDPEMMGYNRNMSLLNQSLGAASQLPWGQIAQGVGQIGNSIGNWFAGGDPFGGFASNYEIPYDFGQGLDPFGGV